MSPVPPLWATWGSVDRHALEFAGWWLPLSVLVGALLWQFTLKNLSVRPAANDDGATGHLARRCFESFQPARDWPWLLAGGTAWLLLVDGGAFARGFFRWDDFAFVQDARVAASLPQLLGQYHNDHALPLFRLWISAGLALGGPHASADALAAIFNAGNFATCLAVVVLGALLLGQFQVRRASLVLYGALVWCWPGWGEFVTGFYTLIVYPQTLAVAFAAVIAGLRYAQGGSSGWLAGCLAGTLVAAGLDVSGLFVFPVVLAFVLLTDGGPHRRRVLVASVGLLFAAALYYHFIWFRHPLSGRELVQNPAGIMLEQSLRGTLAHGFRRLPLQFVLGLGATGLSPLTPAFTPLLAERFAAVTAGSVLCYTVELLAAVGMLVALCAAYRRLAPVDRRRLLALLFPVVVTIGMLCVARGHGLDTPAVFWPTKYFCLPQAWLAAAAVFAADRLVLGSAGAMARAARWYGALLLATAWLIVSHWQLERALEMPTARRAAGRQGNAAASVERRAEFHALDRALAGLAAQAGDNHLMLPAPAGIYWTHPHLEYGLDSSRGSCFLFGDLMSVDPAAGLQIDEVAAAAVPSRMRELIAADPDLTRLFSEPAAPP